MDHKEKLAELLYEATLIEGSGRDLCEKIADHLMANGVTVQGDELPTNCNQLRWIPVTERLPENEDRVLVCCKTKKGLQTINMAYLFNGCWHGQGSMSGVTHWMPLPEPPKGE